MIAILQRLHECFRWPRVELVEVSNISIVVKIGYRVYRVYDSCRTLEKVDNQLIDNAVVMNCFETTNHSRWVESVLRGHKRDEEGNHAEATG